MLPAAEGQHRRHEHHRAPQDEESEADQGGADPAVRAGDEGVPGGAAGPVRAAEAGRGGEEAAHGEGAAQGHQPGQPAAGDHGHHLAEGQERRRGPEGQAGGAGPPGEFHPRVPGAARGHQPVFEGGHQADGGGARQEQGGQRVSQKGQPGGAQGSGQPAAQTVPQVDHHPGGHTRPRGHRHSSLQVHTLELNLV